MRTALLGAALAAVLCVPTGASAGYAETRIAYNDGVSGLLDRIVRPAVATITTHDPRERLRQVVQTYCHFQATASDRLSGDSLRPQVVTVVGKMLTGPTMQVRVNGGPNETVGGVAEGTVVANALTCSVAWYIDGVRHEEPVALAGIAGAAVVTRSVNTPVGPIEICSQFGLLFLDAVWWQSEKDCEPPANLVARQR